MRVWSVSTVDERLAGQIDGHTFELWGSAEGATLRDFAKLVQQNCDVDPNREEFFEANGASSKLHDNDGDIETHVTLWIVRGITRKKLVLALLSGHGWADRTESYEIKITPKGRILWDTKTTPPGSFARISEQIAAATVTTTKATKR